VLIVLGTGAILFPFITTIAAKIFLGWLFLIGGVVQIAHAFSTKGWSEFLLSLLIGLLYAVAGAWLAFLPLTGIITLTILLAVLFIFEGVMEVGIAIRMRPQNGWGWMLAAGIVAILVGVLIIAQLPSSATWAIGLLVGINMISTGWAYLFLAMAAGKSR
ncbi:MAG: HdeD family acid-resistance protein, partial [Parvibaculaceae bacterium]